MRLSELVKCAEDYFNCEKKWDCNSCSAFEKTGNRQTVCEFFNSINLFYEDEEDEE